MDDSKIVKVARDKKEFSQLIREMRIALHPEFKSITNNQATAIDINQFDLALSQLEGKQIQMIVEAGYAKDEFDSLSREHFMDFSSENPDEWVIRHDPNNAQVILKQ